MNKSITIEQIERFSKQYNSNHINKEIENAITRNGVEATCIDRDILIENQPVFNIELPECKVKNQKESLKCWIFAGLNMIEDNVAKNLNIEVTDLDLSDNYIAFFDKLEKSNNTYENIIMLDNTTYEYINRENILRFCVSETGYFQWFAAIVKKYGIVPKSFMPDVAESMNYKKISDLYFEKVEKDVVHLLNLKNNNVSIEDLRECKEKYLQENYYLLSKLLGEPKLNFDFEYKDKNNEYKRYENMTPVEFKNSYLDLNLDDFISIGNVPMYNKTYYEKYRKKYLGNVFENSYAEFLNLPIENLKELAIKQLRDNVPVWFATHINKYRDKKSGILDTRLYNYDSLLGINTLSKEEASNLNNITMEHAMVFKGVNIIDNKPNRWKVEDSYGTEEKVNGYYTMNDNFFDKFVFNVIIDKKYLNEEQLKLCKKESVLFDIQEPF